MLDINKEIKGYLIATISTLIIGFIYELFSHNVYSGYMQFAFLIPLIGLIKNIILKYLHINLGIVSNNLFNASIITFTIGSIIKGVLDIYGTTNYLIAVYLLIGSILLLLSMITIKKEI